MAAKETMLARWHHVGAHGDQKLQPKLQERKRFLFLEVFLGKNTVASIATRLKTWKFAHFSNVNHILGKCRRPAAPFSAFHIMPTHGRIQAPHTPLYRGLERLVTTLSPQTRFPSVLTPKVFCDWQDGRASHTCSAHFHKESMKTL